MAYDQIQGAAEDRKRRSRLASRQNPDEGGASPLREGSHRHTFAKAMDEAASAFSVSPESSDVDEGEEEDDDYDGRSTPTETTGTAGRKTDSTQNTASSSSGRARRA